MAEGSLVDAAYGLRETIEAHADDGERLRRLPTPTVKALVDADLMRMCVPAVYGGPEADPMTMVAAIEAVSIADGAAGWCSMIASTTSSMAAFLPEVSAREIYGDRTSVTGGVFAPNGHGGGRPPRRRRRLRGDRPLGVGQWDPALPVGARRRVVR